MNAGYNRRLKMSELDQMQDWEDDCYEIICGDCGGEMDSCTLGDETYYRCRLCGLGNPMGEQ